MWTYSGGGFRMNTGLMVFLVGGFGLNFNLGYDGHNFKLVIFNLSGDTNECIKIGDEILKHILFMHPDLVTDFIQKKFGLYSELTYFY